MIKKYFIALLLLVSIAGTAQNKKGKVAPQDNDTVIYRQAIKYGDAGVAINCLYSLMAKDPQNIAYKDSLARLYFTVGSYRQCLKVCEEIISKRPNDTFTLRIMGISHQSLGMAIEAIEDYEKVIKLTGSAYDYYQKAALEYQVKRLQECKLSVEEVIKTAKPGEMITLYIDRENKQEVPLRAAAFNLYGMIAKDINDTASARFLFNEALKMMPDFYFAQANIAELDEMGKKKTNTPETRDPVLIDPKRGK
jgi:tetratricopeptide (TPR) repeat protein